MEDTTISSLGIIRHDVAVPSNQKNRIRRRVTLPPRAILESILLQYYDTTRDTYYDDDNDNHEEDDVTANGTESYKDTCRVSIDTVIISSVVVVQNRSFVLTHISSLFFCALYMEHATAYGDE
jgi:hypothetical protein